MSCPSIYSLHLHPLFCSRYGRPLTRSPYGDRGLFVVAAPFDFVVTPASSFVRHTRACRRPLINLLPLAEGAVAERLRGSCWRRYQIGLDGAGPPPPSAPPLQGEERDYAKVSGCRGYLAESSTVSPRGRCVNVSARARRGPIEIPAAEGGNDRVGRGGRTVEEGRFCNDPLRSRLRRHRRHAVSSCPDSLVAASRRRPWGPP